MHENKCSFQASSTSWRDFLSGGEILLRLYRFQQRTMKSTACPADRPPSSHTSRHLARKRTKRVQDCGRSRENARATCEATSA